MLKAHDKMTRFEHSCENFVLIILLTALSQYAFISLRSGVCRLILNWTTALSCPSTFRLMCSLSPLYKRKTSVSLGGFNITSRNFLVQYTHKTHTLSWNLCVYMESSWNWTVMKVRFRDVRADSWEFDCDCLIDWCLWCNSSPSGSLSSLPNLVKSSTKILEAIISSSFSASSNHLES